MSVLFVAHGSPKPAYRVEAEALLGRWQQEHPDIQAALSYVEMEPYFSDMIAVSDEPIQVKPLFLHEGKHFKLDVLDVVNASAKTIEMLPALKDTQQVCDILLEGITWDSEQNTQLVIFSHGIGTDLQNKTIKQLADEVTKRIQIPCVIAVIQGEPTLADTLFQCSAAGATDIMILPHFIFSGTWQDKAQQAVKGVQQRHTVNINIAPPMVARKALGKL